MHDRFQYVFAMKNSIGKHSIYTCTQVMHTHIGVRAGGIQATALPVCNNIDTSVAHVAAR